MSVQAPWDLQSSSSSSPQSFCVYTATTSTSTTSEDEGNNPFQVVSATDSNNTDAWSVQAVVYGTEKGSLHYRTYPSLSSNSTNKSNKNNSNSNNKRNKNNTVIPPLSYNNNNAFSSSSSSSSSSAPSLPRAYWPVDLPEGTFPGSIVQIINLTTTAADVTTSMTTGTDDYYEDITTTTTPPVFLILVDDNKGGSGNSGAYASFLVTLKHGSFTKLSSTTTTSSILTNTLPQRITAATVYHNNNSTTSSSGYLLIATGRRLNSIRTSTTTTTKSPKNFHKQQRKQQEEGFQTYEFNNVLLPPPGARGGQDSLQILFGGRVAVIAVGNSVVAVVGTDPTTTTTTTTAASTEITKVITFAQSSQVHPIVIVDIQDKSMDPDWASLFVANGRECAVIDIHYDSSNNTLDIHNNNKTNNSNKLISVAPPRNGMVTCASPILAAASSWPWLTILNSDGLISIRSPSCLAIPLKTIEVGTKPNDFFGLMKMIASGDGNSSSSSSSTVPWIVSCSHSGQAKPLQCRKDTRQDLADRLMRRAIDAFGNNGFPRSELAEALHASFTATSYVGPEPTPYTKDLFRQYLEAILGLTDFEGGAKPGWPTEYDNTQEVDDGEEEKGLERASNRGEFGAFDKAQQQISTSSSSPFALSSPIVTEATPNALLTGTALLCLVCTQLSPTPKASLANRAAKACAAKMGVVVNSTHKSATLVNELIAEQLLKDSTSMPNRSSLTRSSQRNQVNMEYVEAATWLLRSCGKHERAIDALYERLQKHRSPENSSNSSNKVGFWSQIKYESYTATHLSELWSTTSEDACKLVLESPATKRLLEHNPVLGLNVFTVLHPQNANQWRQLNARDDPLANGKYPAQVVKLLKSINPAVSYSEQQLSQSSQDDEGMIISGDDEGEVLPMNSGRSLAVSFLESAIGITTGRPTEEDEFDSLPNDESVEERISDFHDELCYLLLEGVLSEQRGDEGQEDYDSTSLGRIYRKKLRRLLRWPSAKVRSERLMKSLPKAFLQEQALVMGRMGRHEDALRLLYCECKSMELALEYCDLRHERQVAKREMERARLASRGLLEDDRDDSNQYSASKKSNRDGCAYLPLVRVALDSDVDKKRGTAAAIQVLALRRGAIDRAAALRLLPKHVPVSAVARPFLIPALVESESQARRLRVVSSLLRARHVALKQQLTDAQLKAQANLHVLPQLQAMNLGDPLHSTKSMKVNPSLSASATFPKVVVIKHFFPRHVVIQAKVTNSSAVIDGRGLSNVAFIVAESSEEAIQPLTQIPIKLLPYEASGSCWFVMSAAPNRMEGAAILTCELRYTVLGVDVTTGAPLSFGHAAGSGRTFVEELQDLEILQSNFS